MWQYQIRLTVNVKERYERVKCNLLYGVLTEASESLPHFAYAKLGIHLDEHTLRVRNDGARILLR